MSTYLRGWQQYSAFNGRATVSEFWVFFGANLLIVAALYQGELALNLTFAAEGFGYFSTAFMLAALVPTIALVVRRLHDTGQSPLWLLLYFVPLIGFLVLLFMLSVGGQRGENKFGPDPRGEIVVEPPPDGGPPYASRRGRFVRCPWCGQQNPIGRVECQWCRKPYREPLG